jgi:hypothetical protein
MNGQGASQVNETLLAEERLAARVASQRFRRRKLQHGSGFYCGPLTAYVLAARAMKYS